MHRIRLIQGIVIKLVVIVFLTVAISAVLFFMGLHPNPLGILTALLILFFIFSNQL